MTFPTRSSPLARSLKAGVFLLRLLRDCPGGRRPRYVELRPVTKQGTPYDLYEPEAGSSRTIILVSGLVLQGERDPRLVKFARSLAQSGVRAAAIALPGFQALELTEADYVALADLITALADEKGTPVGIVGFSFGAGLALSVAADPAVSKLVAFLLLFGPYYSLAGIWEAILASRDWAPKSDEEWDDFIWLRMTLAYRRRDQLNLSQDEERELTDLLRNFCAEKALRRKQEFYARVLQHRDPLASARHLVSPDALEKLSAQGKLAGVSARVLILHDERDNLVPPAETQRIFQELSRRPAGRGQRVLITPILSHVNARATWRALDFFRILGMMGEIFR